jgi:hypothetical protein
MMSSASSILSDPYGRVRKKLKQMAETIAAMTPAHRPPEGGRDDYDDHEHERVVGARGLIPHQDEQARDDDRPDRGDGHTCGEYPVARDVAPPHGAHPSNR